MFLVRLLREGQVRDCYGPRIRTDGEQAGIARAEDPTRFSPHRDSDPSYVSPHLGAQRPMAANGELLKERDDGHVLGLTEQLLADVDHSFVLARAEQ